jgi:DNA-binding NarL/FixJ family response regulator
MGGRITRFRGWRAPGALIHSRSNRRTTEESPLDGPDRTPIRVLLVDDHAIMRAAVRNVLTLAGIEVVGEAASAEEAGAVVTSVAPDLAVLDVRMHGAGGIRGAALLKQLHPGIRVLVLSAHDDGATVGRALEAGADGFVPKTASDRELVAAIERVMRGERFPDPAPPPPERPPGLAALTPREKQVVRGLAHGHSNRDVADHLGVGIRTGEQLRRSAFDKLGVATRAELVRIVLAAGLLVPEGCAGPR